jgi:hypothetical protein
MIAFMDFKLHYLPDIVTALSMKLTAYCNVLLRLVYIHASTEG